APGHRHAPRPRRRSRLRHRTRPPRRHRPRTRRALQRPTLPRPPRPARRPIPRRRTRLAHDCHGSTPRLPPQRTHRGALRRRLYLAQRLLSLPRPARRPRAPRGPRMPHRRALLLESATFRRTCFYMCAGEPGRDRARSTPVRTALARRLRRTARAPPDGLARRRTRQLHTGTVRMSRFTPSLTTAAAAARAALDALFGPRTHTPPAPAQRRRPPTHGLASFQQEAVNQAEQILARFGG